MEEDIARIYTITNLKNNYTYVGSTLKTLKERFENHLKRMRDEEDNRLLYEDMRLYGINNFKIVQIDSCHGRHRFIIEEYWYNKLLKEGYALYDIKQGASHSKNTKQRLAFVRNNKNIFDYNSEEFKEKVSEATRGELNGMYGKKGKDAVNGRVVLALNDKDEVIHSFPSVQVALTFLGIKGHVKLNEACRNNTKYRGYYWKKEWINR